MPSFGLLSEHARERTGMPEGWEAYRVESLPAGSKAEVIHVTGCMSPPLVMRGPRKGKPNWRRMDKSTVRETYIPVTEHDAWEIAWETRTGKCSMCKGRTHVFSSWSKGEGTKTRPCPRCLGTGDAPAAGKGE